MSSINEKPAFSFLQGGGEIGELTRNYDWSQTSLGMPDTWPQSLRTTLSILLNSKFPMFLYWEKELLCFYNDAYRPSLGNSGKHPSALGKPAEIVWKEIWPVIKPWIDQILSGGEATWNENQLVPIYRNGQMENVYWTFSYSAVNDESGHPSGVLVTCVETTKTVETLQKLRPSQHRFESLIKQATIGVVILMGEELRVEMVNEIYAGLMERTIDDLIGKPLFDVIPEAREHFIDLLNKVRIQGESVYLYDHPFFVYKNGQKKEGYLHIVYQPYREVDGAITGVMATCHDVTQQVLTRKRLEESESYFRQLTDTVPAIIWITGPDGYCTYLNKNWYAFTGQTREEAEGYGWLNTTHPDDAEQAANVFLDANNRRVPFNTTYRLRDKTGQYRWVIDSGSSKFSADGVYEGMIGTVVDIHEQKVAEEKIRQSEARFRDLIAAAPAGIGLFVGRDLIIENPNQTFIDIVGKGSDIIGKPLREAMPELLTEGQPFLKILDDVYTTRKMFQTTGSMVKIVQNGVLNDNYYNISYTPLLNADGDTYAILDIAIDVTGQILAQQKLEESEERTRLAIEAAELGTYELNLLTNEMLTSARFDDIFDVHNTTDRGQFVFAIHPDDLAIREQAHTESYKTGLLDYTARIIKRTGNVNWIRARGRVYFDEKKTPVRLLGVVQDITEQKELERQKDSFLGIASHELKTPVTSMKAYAQLMEKVFRRNGDTKNAELVAKMNYQANRLSSLIADLLDVTKINNGRLQFNFTTFNFNEMVEDVIEETQRTSPTHEIKKQFSFTGLVYGDRERIGQVVVNLITNAIKYSPDTRHIIVCTESKNNEVQLSVQDFGIGISADKKDKVFEQFYRVSGTREHTFPGLGLGLYISSEIIKRMHGRIWVNSTEGKGSTFYFAVPLQ